MSFKICMVGCGSMAYAMHGPSCKMYEKLHKDAEFAACCDIVEERAINFKEKFNLPRYYTDIGTMLDTEKPQAVCLICHVDLTAELSCKILEKGYPLIMEKPPGMIIGETQRMIQAAKGVPNQVAFNRRYIPLVKKLKNLLAELNCLDGITDIQYRMLRVNRKDPDFSTTAIHGIDLIRHIAGSDYKEISFKYQEQSNLGPNVANIHLYCEMESGVIAHLDFLPVSGMVVERLEINTVKGLFYLNLPMFSNVDYEGKLIHYADNEVKYSINGYDAAESMENYVVSGFYHENADFFDDIKNGRKPCGCLESGLQSVEVAEYVRKRLPLYKKG